MDMKQNSFKNYENQQKNDSTIIKNKQNSFKNNGTQPKRFV